MIMFALRRRWLVGLIVSCLLILPALSVTAQSVLQSYSTAAPLQFGLIVELESKSSGKVEPLAQTSATKMFGAVVNPNASPVSLSATTGSQQAYVATSGTYNVLVSNQDGSIAPGDYITISSLDGIGMKAGDNDSTVLGKATTIFNGTNALSTAMLKNGSHPTTVELGEVSVNIAVSRNPLQATSSPDLPSFLRSASQSFANRPVSTPRVYLGLTVLLISAIIAGSLLYAGVRSGITAIGRNPLSKKSIIRSLIQVTLTSLIVFIVGLFAVYLILRY
jgi:hypothetical protein